MGEKKGFLMKVVVIGGGPAGMMAAITASKNGNEVYLLEKNDRLGKKLLITGKGRCNITSSLDIKDFIQNVLEMECFYIVPIINLQIKI